jgi:hypothetical protein
MAGWTGIVLWCWDWTGTWWPPLTCRIWICCCRIVVQVFLHLSTNYLLLSPGFIPEVVTHWTCCISPMGWQLMSQLYVTSFPGTFLLLSMMTSLWYLCCIVSIVGFVKFSTTNLVPTIWINGNTKSFLVETDQFLSPGGGNQEVLGHFQTSENAEQRTAREAVSSNRAFQLACLWGQGVSGPILTPWNFAASSS